MWINVNYSTGFKRVTYNFWDGRKKNEFKTDFIDFIQKVRSGKRKTVNLDTHKHTRTSAYQGSQYGNYHKFCVK